MSTKSIYRAEVFVQIVVPRTVVIRAESEAEARDKLYEAAVSTLHESVRIYADEVTETSRMVKVDA